MQENSLLDAGAARRVASVTPRLRRRSRRLKAWLPYLLVAPAVIYLLGITLYPGIYAVVQSFHAVKFGPWNPVGFDNYVKPGRLSVWGALKNTAIIGAIALTLQCVLA